MVRSRVGFILGSCGKPRGRVASETSLQIAKKKKKKKSASFEKRALERGDLY